MPRFIYEGSEPAFVVRGVSLPIGVAVPVADELIAHKLRCMGVRELVEEQIPEPSPELSPAAEPKRGPGRPRKVRP